MRRPDILFSLPTESAPGLCLEYKGSVHLGGHRVVDDDIRANELLAIGMRQYSVWREQCESVAYMDALIDGAVRRDLGLTRNRPGLRRADLELARREALLAELDVIDGLSWGRSSEDPRVRHVHARVAEAAELC